MNEIESYTEARAELRVELSRIPEYVQRQLEFIDSRISEGFELILNDGETGTVVHNVTCKAIARQFDRELAWRDVKDEIEGELAKKGFVPHALNAVPGKMPIFTTRERVELLPEYRACGTCQPMLAQRDKKLPRRIPSTKLQSLNQSHVGREFVAADGAELGKLKSFRVVAEFDSGTLTSDDTAFVSMVPADSDLVSLQALIHSQSK